MLLVTHEMRVASWADRDVLLRDGRLLNEGVVGDSGAAPTTSLAGAAA
jgi:putative ABC transport system ATP-binding protein